MDQSAGWLGFAGLCLSPFPLCHFPFPSAIFPHSRHHLRRRNHPLAPPGTTSRCSATLAASWRGGLKIYEHPRKTAPNGGLIDDLLPAMPGQSPGMRRHGGLRVFPACPRFLFPLYYCHRARVCVWVGGRLGRFVPLLIMNPFFRVGVPLFILPHPLRGPRGALALASPGTAAAREARKINSGPGGCGGGAPSAPGAAHVCHAGSRDSLAAPWASAGLIYCFTRTALRPPSPATIPQSLAAGPALTVPLYLGEVQCVRATRSAKKGVSAIRLRDKHGVPVRPKVDTPL